MDKPERPIPTLVGRTQHRTKDGRITSDKIQKRIVDIENKLLSIERSKSSFECLDESLMISVDYLKELVSKLPSLYESSEVDQKREIINLLLLNCETDGENVGYTWQKPFDMFLKMKSCSSNRE